VPEADRPHSPTESAAGKRRCLPLTWDVRWWVGWWLSTASLPGPRGTPSLFVMRRRRAVEKLCTLAEACESVKNWPPEPPFLLGAYAFGLA